MARRCDNSCFLLGRGRSARWRRSINLPFADCRDQLAITVDKIEMGAARAHDRSGRALPIWQGCHVLADGEVFFMNWRSADSFDGRYFGALPTSAIIGTAEPLGPVRRNHLAAKLQIFRHSFVRSNHGPFLRPGQDLRGRRAWRRSRAAARPARQRLSLDGRKHDGSPAISWDDAVRRGDLDCIDAVGRPGTRRAGVVGYLRHRFSGGKIEKSDTEAAAVPTSFFRGWLAKLISFLR
jgi:hypothetical protein